jgi:predicted small lipoprotein YifL
MKWMVAAMALLALIGCEQREVMNEPPAPAEQKMVMIPAQGQGTPQMDKNAGANAVAPAPVNPTAMPDGVQPGDRQ